MKQLFKIFIGFLLGSSLLISCDTIDEGIVKNYGKDTANVPDTNKTEAKVRKVLVEDFTGHKCPNCPQAATVLSELEGIYGEQIIPMALHVTSQFAAPNAAQGFPAEYRTVDGTAIDDFFKISVAGLPKGMVNRKGYPTNEHIISYSDWGSKVGQLLAQPADAWIKITNTFDVATNKVTSAIATEFLTDLPGEYKLSVFLTQDSIISPQLDGTLGIIVTNYVHKHMLRKALNNAFGETIATNPVASTASINKTYSLVLLPEWTPKNCHIVAFVYNATTYEVVQAEQQLVK
jgi:thiol-disulfide isomerase/thioredoxin